MDAIYDYLVVGAGSAGCAVAARLCVDPRVRVALIEAGGQDDDPAIKIPAAFPTLFGGEHDWDFRTTPQRGLAGRVIRCPRGRGLGGSSSINANVWTRGHQADFDGWAGVGGPGWSFAGVEPLFRRIEHRAGAHIPSLYGVDGPLYVENVRGESEATASFLAACAELGLPFSEDVNAPDNTGAGRVSTSQRRGERWSSADGYLRSISHSNLDVLTHLHVQRITISDRRATGVEALSRSGRSVALVARREVIVSAGAINSPHLLMLSGIGPEGPLARHGIECVSPLPGVGTGLQDHLFVPLIVHCPRPVTLASAGGSDAAEAYKLHRRGPLTSNIAEAACFLASGAEQPAPDLEIAFLPVAFVNDGLESQSEHALTIAAVLLQPNSTGRVRLRSAAAADPPEIDPGYLTDPGGDDIRRLRHGLEIARSLFGTAALAPYTGDQWFEDLDLGDPDSVDQHIRHHSGSAFHLVGTCRMGSDSGAVVDTELRVHGVSGLRVADASVMPRITRGHTHAPSVVIGERAADLIRGT
ncbi:GMC family oxidoreductase [Kitasatospora sp. NPDC058046]|uniref:GMC family oxidoreductase n=1 Tax=Kitasatospora sp. NPDC058046 TaxID=3346312 RepID=UPI0036D8CE8C